MLLGPDQEQLLLEQRNEGQAVDRGLATVEHGQDPCVRS